MVTPADLEAFQQQLRQEMTDVIQQVREEVGHVEQHNEALQNVSKLCRISDVFPRNWEGSREKESSGALCQTYTCGCKNGQMQKWSDEGEKMLVRVQSIDKFDNNVIAFDCPDDKFRSIEDRCTRFCTERHPTNHWEQCSKQDETWHAVVRRHGQRDMSDNNSAYAALISNITEKDRAKDVEQFDDILSTFTNEMNKFECRFGKISDEEKMLTVKKLMLTEVY